MGQCNGNAETLRKFISQSTLQNGFIALHLSRPSTRNHKFQYSYSDKNKTVCGGRDRLIKELMPYFVF